MYITIPRTASPCQSSRLDTTCASAAVNRPRVSTSWTTCARVAIRIATVGTPTNRNTPTPSLRVARSCATSVCAFSAKYGNSRTIAPRDTREASASAIVHEYARCEMLPAGSAEARYRSITGTAGTGSREHTTSGTFRKGWSGLLRLSCGRRGANSVLADAASNTTHCNADPANAPTARLFTPHSSANSRPKMAIRDGGMKCTNDGTTKTLSKYLKY